ncbi:MULTISPECIES: proline/glycine betaine ABC transporter permease [unclassified Oceanispirochaeta]|uniref:ABC transporter permease n=1 Tax=unclassified Oceanispirochaeta TaxID=2635722 RepID=UPI000E09DECF|nr:MULTISPECIES: proline/glycine betaine ABC transporter permease [unclassified Oceanispirochaeta]MBF9014658.1 proline/glycine betaine ABC transporter permease [Oceanispirochaeta sp. M2]NPD70914.1 proline/glycine betaine ABC transporter permease [Oceanispirochaeta sp. M1]RDG33749.1 proline/glycine betaine ABC transporter permease [Oceanispirochaeta sp. M1]
MIKFPDIVGIPLAKWIDAIMDWLLENLDGFFDAVGFVILQVVVGIEKIFLFTPWFIIILLVGLAGWKLVGKWKTGIVFMVLMFMIGTFGYWELAMRTLSLVIASVFFSLLIGIPTGIKMARSDRALSILQPLLDGMQTMPSFVYLIPALMFFGMGKVPAMFATIIYAVPPVIRLTNVGIRTVDVEAVEASKAFGATPRQVLIDVQLPLAKPSIMVGINQTTMMALAMVVIGSMIGAKGLGMEVLLSINRIEVGRGFEAGISIVFLAIIIDRITHSFSVKKD